MLSMSENTNNLLINRYLKIFCTKYCTTNAKNVQYLYKILRNELMMQDTMVESFPIRAVAEMTGVNAVTLRAWERRYGLVKPKRTPKGHRVYSSDDIRLIREILQQLSMGMSIGQVARDISDSATTDQPDAGDTWSRYRSSMIDAIVNYDNQGLDAIYNDAMALYPVEIVTTRLIMPLLEELGARWETARGSVAEEHFFSVYLRNKLGARFHHQNIRNSGPKLVVACLPGEHHEFGILLFALMAHSKGYQVILLGADLPITELPHVVDRTRSQGIVLAGSASLDQKATISAIDYLTSGISVPVFVGGAISDICRPALIRLGVHPLGRDFGGSLHGIVNVFKRTN